MAIVVLKDFTKVSKLLGVRRIVSVSFKISSPSSAKPAHFSLYCFSNENLSMSYGYIFISSGFFVFIFGVSIKNLFKSQQVENSFGAVIKEQD